MSVIPVDAKGVEFIPFYDKITHFLIYIILAFLAINTFRLSFKGKFYFKAFIYCFLLGAILECAQYFLPYRTFELLDILANSLGAILGIFIKIP